MIICESQSEYALVFTKPKLTNSFSQNISEKPKKRKISSRFNSVSQEDILAMKEALTKKKIKIN